MAKSLDKIKNEFEAVSDLTKEAYDSIYSDASGRGFRGAGRSLDQKYKIARREYQENPDKTNKEILDAIESEWKKRQDEYKKLQNQKNGLRKELNAAEKAEKKRRETEAKQNLAVSAYDKALNKLSDAEAEIDTYQGGQKYVKAYQEAQVAYDSAIESGAKPKALPAQKITVPSIDKKDKKKKTEGGEVVEPTPEEFFSILADPKNQAELKAIQQDLARNFNWTGKVGDKYSLALQRKIIEISALRDELPESLRGKSLREFITNPPDVDLGLAGGGIGGPSKTVTTTVSKRTKGEINKDINDIALKVLGREITAEDKQSDWYTSLVDSINKMVERGTTTTNVTDRIGAGVSKGRTEIAPGFAQEDIEALIERRLKKADPESLARNERIDFITWMNQALGGR